MNGFERLIAGPLAAAPEGRWLLAGVAEDVLGRRATTWSRTAHGGASASAFPPDGPWDGMVVRLPRSRDDAAMVLELCAARLAPRGELWAGGPQDEGAKGIGKRLGTWFEHVDDELYGGHARAARACSPRPALRSDPEAFRADVTVALPTGAVSLQSWPGLFAHGRLDAGTALLLEHLPSAAGLRVLDLGCGSGVLSVALRSSGPASLDLVDVDALAVHAAARNVPEARVLLADGVPPGGPWDLVVSNPPLHTGATADPDLVPRLAKGLAGRLAPNGVVVLVTHATVPVARLFAAVTPRAETLAARPPYVVWRLSR